MNNNIINTTFVSEWELALLGLIDLFYMFLNFCEEIKINPLTNMWNEH